MEWSETNWTTEITPGPSGHPSAPSFDQDYLTPASSSAPWSAADNATIAAALEFREASRFWVQRVLVPVLVTVGVLGNLVTVVVLTRRRMRSSTNVYLTALAVSDLLFLVFMFSMSLMHYPHFHETPYRSYWEYRRFGLWFTDATSSSSVWLTVSFTVERYIAVCHPLRGKVLCTEKRARTVILAVVLACALSTATTPHEWRVAEHEGRVTLAESPFGAHETYRAVFYWFSSVTFTLLPLVLLGIFNSFLVLAVHRSQRQRFRMTQVDQHESSSSAQTQENRITIVLISVVVLFMLCQMPTAVLLIYTALHPVEGAHEVIAQGLGNIFNFLMAVHSSCNFLLYCALSDKYRRTFMLAFFPKCAPPPTSGPGASSSAYSAASTYRGSASMRVRSDANGSGTDPGAPLKRHVSAYIPRPRVQSSPKP